MRLLLLLLLLTSSVSVFSQNKEVNQVIYVKPASLILGTLSTSYERKIIDRHSLYIGFPIYFKRDITNSLFLRLLAPFGDNYLYSYDQITNSTVKDILDDADGLSYISGVGINLGYKIYFSKNSNNLTGFYFNPDFYSFGLKIEAEADAADINYIIENNLYPDLLVDDWDLNTVYEYDSDSKLSLQTVSINVGHQWIRDWFSLDMKVGIGNYIIKYEYDDRITFNSQNIQLNKAKGTEILWLPRFKIKLGVAF